jgi:hypothetical protein
MCACLDLILCKAAMGYEASQAPRSGAWNPFTSFVDGQEQEQGRRRRRSVEVKPPPAPSAGPADGFAERPRPLASAPWPGAGRSHARAQTRPRSWRSTPAVPRGRGFAAIAIPLLAGARGSRKSQARWSPPPPGAQSHVRYCARLCGWSNFASSGGNRRHTHSFMSAGSSTPTPAASAVTCKARKGVLIECVVRKFAPQVGVRD